MNAEQNNEFKSSNYELFILALSLLSLLNWVLYFILTDEDILRVVFFVDLVLSFIFMSDFIYRLFTAESKRRYFLSQYGWLDLLSSLPFPQAKIARLGRVARALRLMRAYGLRNMVSEFIRNRAGTALLTVSFLIILVLEFGSLAILIAEHDASEANITTAADALWWSVVTVSTVGYGDRFPVTFLGRITAIIVIIVGVGLFGVVTGFLANRFLDTSDEELDSKVQPDPIPDSSAVILDEITRLRAEQEKSYSELNVKIEGLLKLVGQRNE
jgi:voltage-gated potassium channel